MFRLWASLLAGALVLSISFQNCGEQKAKKSEASAALEVEQPQNQGSLPDEQPAVEEPPATTDPSGQVPGQINAAASLEFGFDATTNTYAYSISLGGGTVGQVTDANNVVVGQLDNAELSALVALIDVKVDGNQIITSGNFNDANQCDPNDLSIVYGRINVAGGNSFVLNSAPLNDCGQDFGKLGPPATRATVNFGGMMVNLQQLLAALQL